MQSGDGNLDLELEQQMLHTYKNFMTGVAKFDELVSAGNKFLTSFQEGLEFIRRPPLDKVSNLVRSVISFNETKRVKEYFEAGCVNTYDSVQSLTKSRTALEELQHLLDDATRIVQAGNEHLFQCCDGGMEVQLIDETNGLEKRGAVFSDTQKHEITDYAIMMAVIYNMIKQDYVMQERIISHLSLKVSAGELESYCLMWSLRPFVDEEIMLQAWKFIP